jgi:transcriptional regulator GlxA family with amidase domain
MTHGDIAKSGEPKRLGLLLVDGFPLMAYASVLEAYRAANALSGRQLYRWSHISVSGAPCRASNGATILPDAAVGNPIGCDVFFVFAGGDPTQFADRATFGWLRQIAKGETSIVGVSGGAYVMARAGLLEGRRATVHWEYREAFIEDFPGVICEAGLFVFDGRRITCAGGMAGMDLAVELIERDHGHALAVAVSDWFIRSESRLADRPQRLSLRNRYDVANDRVLRVLGHMEETIEEPVPRERLAKIGEVSVRQLERLFQAHLGSSINATYLHMRLNHAEQLLRSTAMNATEVAVACGFTNLSHFSRAFRNKFGRAPTTERKQRRETSRRQGPGA